MIKVKKKLRQLSQKILQKYIFKKKQKQLKYKMYLIDIIHCLSNRTVLLYFLPILHFQSKFFNHTKIKNLQNNRKDIK